MTPLLATVLLGLDVRDLKGRMTALPLRRPDRALSHVRWRIPKQSSSRRRRYQSGKLAISRPPLKQPCLSIRQLLPKSPLITQSLKPAIKSYLFNLTSPSTSKFPLSAQKTKCTTQIGSINHQQAASKLSSPCKIFPSRSISSHLSLCEQSLSLVSISLVRKTQS